MWKTLSMSQPVRWLRGLRPDRNALRRTTDRAEAAIVAAVLIALAVCVPLAAIMAGKLAAADSVPRDARQPVTYQVSAVLTTDATAQLSYRYTAPTDYQALARWIAPDSAQRSGKIPVSVGAKAGDTVRIQVTANGTPVTGPAQPWPASHVGMIEFLAGSGAVLLLLCLGATARSLLDRRRMAAWDADWSVTEPRWSSRL